MKYTRRLGEKIAEEKVFEQEQKALRKKYDVKEEGVIRVEKKRLSEIMINGLSGIISKTIRIVLIVLATVGGLCLLYPNTRTEMYILFLDLLNQAQNLVQM